MIYFCFLFSSVFHSYYLYLLGSCNSTYIFLSVFTTLLHFHFQISPPSTTKTWHPPSSEHCSSLSQEMLNGQPQVTLGFTYDVKIEDFQIYFYPWPLQTYQTQSKIAPSLCILTINICEKIIKMPIGHSISMSQTCPKG